MSEPEFPPELVQRCADKGWDAYSMALDDSIPDFTDEDEDRAFAIAVLRESGHAELVAALQLLRINYSLRPMDERMIEAALRKAGAL